MPRVDSAMSADLLESKRPRGRPKAEPTAPVSTRLPQRHHDWLIKRALAGDVSVSKLVQEIVQHAIDQRRQK